MSAHLADPLSQHAAAGRASLMNGPNTNTPLQAVLYFVPGGRPHCLTCRVVRHRRGGLDCADVPEGLGVSYSERTRARPCLHRPFCTLNTDTAGAVRFSADGYSALINLSLLELPLSHA